MLWRPHDFNIIYISEIIFFPLLDFKKLLYENVRLSQEWCVCSFLGQNFKGRATKASSVGVESTWKSLKKKKNPVLDIENICFCNSTLYWLLLSGIVTPNIYRGRLDSVQFKCSFGRGKKNNRKAYFPLECNRRHVRTNHQVPEAPVASSWDFIFVCRTWKKLR